MLFWTESFWNSMQRDTPSIFNNNWQKLTVELHKSGQLTVDKIRQNKIGNCLKYSFIYPLYNSSGIFSGLFCWVDSNFKTWSWKANLLV